jgi:hypothetical protein
LKHYKFSIITAAKDSNSTIEKTFRSIKCQNYHHYENIVIDSSKNRLLNRKFKSKFKFKYIYKKLSLYEALNLGIKKSRGEIIFFLHSNDFFYNSNVLKKINYLFNKKECDACYGDIKIISKNKMYRNWQFKNFNKKNLYFGEFPPHTGLFVKKKIFKKYGMFKLNYRIASDYDLILRFFIKNNNKILYLEKYITNMTMGGTSTKSIKNIIIANYECYKSLRKNNIKYPLIIIFFKIIRKILQIRFGT